jgi:hypothetical protein
MHPELHGPAQATPDATKRKAVDRTELIHLCGNCRTPHKADGDRLRPLTPAERFAVEMEIPNTMRAVERMVLPAATDRVKGTMVVTMPEGRS